MGKIMNWIKLILNKLSPRKTVKTVEVNNPVKPDSSNPSTTSNSSKPAPIEPVKKYKKIAIIIGHGHGDGGADSWDGKRNEFEYNSIVANYIKSKVTDRDIKLFWRGRSGITGVNTQVNLWDDDLSIELHLNSADVPARGCEILCLGSDKAAISLGQDLAAAFCLKFGRKLRDEDGVKELKKKDRGHYSLALVDDGKPSILVEPFFISNKNEWIDPLILADFYVNWIEELS